MTKEQIEARVQCHLDAIKPAQLGNLGKIFNSIKDGMSKPEDWFPKEPEAEKPDTPKKQSGSKLRDALKVPAKEDAATPEKPAGKPQDGELGL